MGKAIERSDSREAPDRRETGVVRLAVVGDLLLATSPTGEPVPAVPLADRLAPVRPLLERCDLVFGNLECTLAAGARVVSTEPRVIATPELMADALDAGFTIVSLANNHTFDYFEEGFGRVLAMLRERGIAHMGAGARLAEAEAPAILEVRGVRLAVLAAVDPRTGPTPVAAPDAAGVAPLEVERMAEAIRRLRRQVHHVIVSLHWGEERLRVPSPEQVRRAHALADAGASLIVGHHPHVVQGLERYGGAAIAYSLGNFITNEVPFTDGDRVVWDRTGRTGCILVAELAADGLRTVTQTPTYDSGRQIAEDRSGFGARHLARVNRAVARGISPARYRWEHFRANTLKPALRYLAWSKLKTLRLRHLGRALAGIFRAHRAG